MANRKRAELSVRQERAILVGVILPKSTADPRDPLGELASLADTAGAKVVGTVLQKRPGINPSTYVGSGKVLEIAALAIEQKADVVIFDNELSLGQIGSLERMINTEAGSPRTGGIKVLDRSELILDIFATRAQTHEAKLQVELAQMQYTYPRLTQMWGHLERIAGGSPAAGIGTRGPGEQQLEIDRRLVRKRISRLRDEIEMIQKRRSRMVAERQHFTACLVGYTNAGKSTLFNTLTAAKTVADDKLFTTLDTKTRAWKVSRGNTVLLSDTVGFVRDLPHHLVASFKATLEEVVHADLLLHVLDVGNPHAQQQYESVHNVLKEIGASGKPEILLLNKIDTPEGEESFPEWRTIHFGSIALSAKTGKGVGKLHEAVAGQLRERQVEVTLETDSGNGKLLAFIESHSQVNGREFTDGRVEMRATMGRQILEELGRNPEIVVKRVE